MVRRSFFFQAEDGIRARDVTGVQTCALPISRSGFGADQVEALNPERVHEAGVVVDDHVERPLEVEIGRASCRERGTTWEEGGSRNRATNSAIPIASVVAEAVAKPRLRKSGPAIRA